MIVLLDGEVAKTERGGPLGAEIYKRKRMDCDIEN